MVTLEQSGAAGVCDRAWSHRASLVSGSGEVHYLAAGGGGIEFWGNSFVAGAALGHFEDMLDHFGGYTGLRMARSHGRQATN